MHALNLFKFNWRESMSQNRYELNSGKSLNRQNDKLQR